MVALYFYGGNMAGENVGLDLASQTGQEDIVDAIETLATALQNVTGIQGVGIVSIEKTGTSGNVDTYTITLSDGNEETFTVTNGVNGNDGNDGADGIQPPNNDGTYVLQISSGVVGWVSVTIGGSY